MGKDSGRMILFVDLEHRVLATQKPEYYDYVQSKRERTRLHLEEISGKVCQLVHYSDLAALESETARVELIVMSGHNSGYEHYTDEEIEPVRRLLREPPCPIFTICGSFQLMVEVHGGAIGPIGVSAVESSDEDPILPSSMIQENGFCRIEKLDTAREPFSELPAYSLMQEHHYWEVKELPEVFVRCARSEITEHQAIVHQSLPLSGVQFHPEDFDEAHLDGRELLEAVWRWALSD